MEEITQKEYFICLCSKASNVLLNAKLFNLTPKALQDIVLPPPFQVPIVVQTQSSFLSM